MTRTRRLSLQASLVLALGTVGLFTTADNAIAGGDHHWCSGYWECRDTCPAGGEGPNVCNTCNPPIISLQCQEGFEGCPGQFKAYCGFDE